MFRAAEQKSLPSQRPVCRRVLLPAGLYLGAVCLALASVRAEEPDASAPVLGPLPARAPAPKAGADSAELVELGRQLFFDVRLSGTNQMSCGTCHIPGKGWADGLPKGRGHEDRLLTRNTPTVLNAGFQTGFFWDGRAATLEEQALGPIVNPDEMRQDLAELERELAADDSYRRQFSRVFRGKVSRGGIARALAAFQRSLVTGPSQFDRYLRGEEQALSDSARRGLELFRGEAGCIRCHHGMLLTDGKFYRLGVDYEDIGRQAVTKDSADRYRFRTPSLRNVALTAPYMHNGSRRTLTDVVTFYYRGIPAAATADRTPDVQPLQDRSFTEVADLVAFLNALTGTLPEVAVPAADQPPAGTH